MKAPNKTYRHYGWECSPYSSKTRSYLRYKHIPFKDIHPTIFGIKEVIEKRVGFIMMPIVICPDDTTLQDTSYIIDVLEEAHSERPVTPTTPKQKLVSYLFELFADEWLPIIAMHSRWNNPINKKFAFKEFGQQALPFLPGFASNPLGKMFGEKMQSYLPVLGITERTAPEIETWMRELFEQLDAHFSEHPFLCGTKPCLGDFALYGPLYAHVWRDPNWRENFEAYTHLNAWRIQLGGPADINGTYLANDDVPHTLWPILTRMFNEQFPTLIETVRRIESYLDEHENSKRFPRGLGELEFKLGNAQEKRKVMTFQQWMLQRSLDCYKNFEASDKESVDQFLQEIGGYKAMQIQLKYRLTRKNFRVVPQ